MRSGNRRGRPGLGRYGAGFGQQRAVQGPGRAARGVSLFLGPLGPAGVVLIFAGLYVVSALLTLCLTLPDGPATPAPPAAEPVGRAALRA
ncbi:hypothetical protein [Streptomyces decoyicus]